MKNVTFFYQGRWISQLKKGPRETRTTKVKENYTLNLILVVEGGVKHAAEPDLWNSLKQPTEEQVHFMPFIAL